MKARTREFIKSIFHRYYTVQKSGCWVWKSKKGESGTTEE